MMTYAEVAQLEMFQAVKCIRTESDLNDLKMTLSRFFSEKAQKEIDRLWDQGILDQSKLDDLRSQHLRTPYRQ